MVWVRSARARTWAVDSSPVTSSAGLPLVWANFLATSSSRVDLPTPGSPASSSTAPGIRPPPSTRSSSAMPVGSARATEASCRLIGSAATRGVTGAGRVSAAARTPSSAIVPQAWHSGQRPTQRIAVIPHSVQA